MWRYIARRVLMAIPLIVGIIVFNFFLIQLAPGDLADVVASDQGGGAADAGFVQELRRAYGLDLPVLTQLWVHLQKVAMLDFGFSHRYGAPVSDLIVSRLGATLLLALTSLVLAVLVGAVLGLVASRRPGGLTDGLVSILATLAYSAPLFWVGLMLVVLFAVQLQWLPAGGFQEITQVPLNGLALLADRARHLVLPAATLALFFVAIYARLTRASMIEAMSQDYIRTAKAKGLREGRIVFRHGFRNALLPLVTMVGLQAGSLLGGSVVVETVFAWPGMGRLAFEAVSNRDLNLLLSIMLLSSLVVVVMNLLVDILYVWLDPRIEVTS
ncbi:ABC transporter permease (plasmid) [Microvirga ossetica]|uniref:ABC transporter permease n=1 Tax=Microvirga ossetica TaxID=1882682 RepID=A0A1B2EZ83_9HYPH|nr:ABC transporter permease [Microvirga ossetica]ANY85295.1 ABC transporter permease [Microvirga ossetica]